MKSIFFTLILIMSNQLLADDCNAPYRLTLQQNQEIYFKGDKSALELQLLDHEGQPTKACEPQVIQFNTTNPDQRVSEKELTIPVGSSKLEIPITFDKLGLYRFSAGNERLYSIILNIIAKDPGTLSDDSKSAIVRSASSPNQDCKPLELIDRMTPWKVSLWAGTEEGVPANGKHPVIIAASIESKQHYTDRDVEIVLEITGGTLSSPSITIPRCNSIGQVEITSNKPGPVSVSFKRSIGIHMKPVNDRPVAIEFLPPISDIQINSPKTLNLLEEGEITIRLVSEEGKALQSTKHSIFLKTSGITRLETQSACHENQLCFSEGQSYVSAKLTPLSTGEIEIVGHAANLPTAKSIIKVAWPKNHLLLSILAGVLAGAIFLIYGWILKKKNYSSAKAFLIVLSISILGAIVTHFSFLSIFPFNQDIPVWISLAFTNFGVSLLGGLLFTPITNAFSFPKPELSTASPPIVLLLGAKSTNNPLDAVPEEVNLLRKLFDGFGNSFLTVFEPYLTRVGLGDLLRKYSDQVAIIHFAGHSSDKALVANDETVYSKHIAALLATWKYKPILIFLNGCNSAGQVRNFHDAGVPCVIATNQSIDDKIAARFSREFYTELLSKPEKMTLEQAFRRAGPSAMMDKEGQPRTVELDIISESNNQWHWGVYPAAGMEDISKNFTFEDSIKKFKETLNNTDNRVWFNYHN